MISRLREQLMEADRQNERQGIVWETLRRIADELDRLGVSYAVVGGIALQHYGIGRSTEDVDILISPADLKKVHERLVGHGYGRKSPSSRHLRDDVTRVRVEFLVAGEFPGDGKPKPVSFPEPTGVSQRSDDGLSFVTLEKLIELKLASAMTAPHRIKDRADVLELIHRLKLAPSFADRLAPYVQADFQALAALPPPTDAD
jgi:hypothetical protein